MTNMDLFGTNLTNLLWVGAGRGQGVFVGLDVRVDGRGKKWLIPAAHEEGEVECNTKWH